MYLYTYERGVFVEIVLPFAVSPLGTALSWTPLPPPASLTGHLLLRQWLQSAH